MVLIFLIVSELQVHTSKKLHLSVGFFTVGSLL
jgi:hypothetical protein